jgi:hypothetical protein
MSVKGQVIIAAVALVLLGIMLNLLLRRRINEEVCLIWIIALGAVVVLMVVPGLADRLTRWVGAVYPASALTLCALAFIGGMLAYMSVKLSRLAQDVKALTQQLALLEEDQRSADERA